MRKTSQQDFRLNRAIDEAKEVADTVDRFHGLSLQFPSVGADSPIATALAVRVLVLAVIFNEVAHFSDCFVVYTRPGPKLFLAT
jgi:hypothetical protein